MTKLLCSVLLACGITLAAVTPMSATPKKILVVTVTTAFRHSSIETAENVLARLAQDSGDFIVDFVRQPPGAPKMPGKPLPPRDGVETPAYQEALKGWTAADVSYRAALEKWLPAAREALMPLKPENLTRADYDAVLFANTSGTLPLPDKEGFLKWIADGHAFIGVHGASDTFHDDVPFITMLGGEFGWHGAQVAVDCESMDRTNPATSPLPPSWKVFDEIYLVKNFRRDAVQTLLSLDQHPNEKTPGFYPLAWCKPYGRGRVFYTALGHREDLWDPSAPGERKNSPDAARQFQQHLLGGIRWALGMEKVADPGTAP